MLIRVKKNILVRTNVLICLIIIVGFLVTAVLSYRANYSASLENIEQVSDLTSEGIYYQMTTTFTKPVNISLTMANDSLLKDLLSREEGGEDSAYLKTLQNYLQGYREKYGYDSVFLVSSATGRYYNFNGLDRVLEPGDPENEWYYEMLESGLEYNLVVDNDEVEGAENAITVFVNCKIRDEGGAAIGIVGVGMKIEGLQSLLKSYRQEFGVEAFLIDGSGMIEVSADYTGYQLVSFFGLYGYSDQTRREVLGWREEGTARKFWTSELADAQANNYLVTRYIPELEWHLVVERDTEAMVDELNRQVVETVLIIAAIITAILVVVTHVIRGFNRRLITLTRSAVQERRTVFEEATEQLFENIYELDITRNRSANQATEEYFESLGAPPGTPYDKALHIIAEKQIKPEFRKGYLDTFSPEPVLRAFKEGKDALEYEFMISNGGEYYWMRITARLVQLESDGSVHMLVYRQNIDAEKRQEERMLVLAQTDEMTGLYTKTATQQRIEQALRESPEQLFAFFIFDIDSFKDANDRYGHAFGDTVIETFTATLRGHFRKDDVIGRIGGDEFAAFIPVPNPEWAEGKAAELSGALNWTHTREDKSWEVSASIGVAFAPRDGCDRKTLYKKADIALYETKKRGRNGYTLYHE